VTVTVTRRAVSRRVTRIVVVLAHRGGEHMVAVVRGSRQRGRDRLRGNREPRRGRSPAGPAIVRQALEDLGPAFVKIGQLLSTRPDLMPAAYQRELAKLQDAALPEPPGTVEALLRAELQRPLGEVFAWFDPAPLAAASIGQVHAARLTDGTDVVVKVARPGAVDTVEVDLAVLERSAALVARLVPAARRFGLTMLAAELAATLRAELDYETEAANAERIRTDLAGDPSVHVPAVHRQATTRRVITLERVVGTKVSDLAALDRAGIDRPALARRVVDLVLGMVFEHGFFHADPHPGNLFVEPDGRIGLIDFGMVGRLAPDTRAVLGRLFVATAAADAPALATHLVALGTTTRPVDMARLTRDVADLLAHVTAGPLGEFRIGPLLLAELALVRRHRLRLPPDLALLVKTATMTESLAAELDPAFLILPAFAPYAARLLGAAGAGTPPPELDTRRGS
jgi:ubiquinone biosynthesis protein